MNDRVTDPFVPRVGAVLSADIAVPEHARVVSFYANVLGTGEHPRWVGNDLLNDIGFPIVGVGKRSPEYEHLPLQWMPHIQVSDVAASVERTVARGGTTLLHGKDDVGNSQFAVLADPNGAAFGVIPVSPAPPTAASEAERLARARSGRIAWLDLTVSDAASTRDFYRDVVEWTAEDVAMVDAEEPYADYCMKADEAVAGVCWARGVNLGLPPVWLIYLPVGDLEESLRRAETGGGTIVKASRGSDGVCSSAVIRDPVGAHLALVPATGA